MGDCKPPAPATPPGLRWLGVAVVLLGVGWRLPDITHWPLPVHTMLQYENALTVRRLWLRLRPQPLSEDERRWLETVGGRVKAPPIIEGLTALTYLPDNTERPWTSGVFTAAAWLLGGAFLFRAGRRLSGTGGAWVALAYYFLTPFGILLSRSFQHEAMMTGAYLAALWWLLRGAEDCGWRHTLAAGTICGLAGLAKPGFVLLPLAGAYLGLSLAKSGLRRTVTSPATYIFLVLTALPSVLYVWLFLPGESHQLLPRLLLTVDFYRGWGRNAGTVLGWVPVLGAVVGLGLLIRQRRALPASFLAGLTAGYIAYALTFNYASMTHDYYLAPAIPVVALGLASLGESLLRGLAQITVSRAAWVTGLAAAAMGSVLYSWPAAPGLFGAGDATEARREEEAGRVVGRDATVICLGRGYGFPLRYHGWLNAYEWPGSVDLWYEQLRNGKVVPTDVRLDDLIASRRPSHFVITEPEELQQQPRLGELLRSRYVVSHEGDRLLIYDLKMPLAGAERTP